MFSSVAACALLVGALLSGCGGDNGGAPMCQPSATPLNAAGFCAPPNIAAGQQLRLQVRETCGGCTGGATHCETVVQGQEIKLRLLGQTCTLPPGAACPAICSINSFDCTVPPLTAGTYRVSAEASTAAAIMMTADATTSATSCTVQ